MIDFQNKNLLFLAPLAGYTDLPFRQIVKKFGVDVTISEMISSNALVHNCAKTFKMIQKSSNETPYIVQIAGSDPKIIKEAVLILNDIDGIDGIDLNCGCPVPKVVKQGAGSALLNDLSKMSKIIQTIKKYSNKRYTSVKARVGFNEKNVTNIAKICENSEVDFLTFHGRLRKDKYKNDKIDYFSILEAKESVKIPIIANGDIVDYEKYKKVKKITKADGVMIGRGAIGNPWIFYQIKNDLPKINKDKIKEIILEHFDSMLEFYGDKAIPIFRKHLHLYSKNFPNATLFRDQINRIDNPLKIKEYINNFWN